MTHLTYLFLVLATVSNALLMSLCRLNNPVYHTFEVLTVLFYAAFGYMIAKSNQFWNWVLVWAMVRFSFYSSIWGYVAYKNPVYLGDGAWTDRLIKTVLFDWMNQSPGALGYLYFIVGIFSVLMYLRIHFNQKQ